MAHWLAWAKDTLVFNDMRDGRFCAVVMNWKTKEERVFPHPVAAVSEDGEWAISINYARLFLTRPDYGYYGNGQDPRKGTVFPEDDGLWLVNMRSGEAKLKVPSGCGAASPSQGRWDPDSLRPALSLGGQATAWECSPGRSRCVTKSSACGRLWQFAHLRPLSLLQRGLAPRSKG